MVVIPRLRHPEIHLEAKFYVADPRSLTYAVSGGEGASLAIKVLVYVHGNFVGFKDFACQNTAEATAVNRPGFRGGSFT